MVDATQNPLARVHSGSRHLALRFARLVVDGRVHHIIVSIERIAAPRVMPHTIEVPALNEDTFAKRLAGETGTRPALKIEPIAGGADRNGAAGAIRRRTRTRARADSRLPQRRHPRRRRLPNCRQCSPANSSSARST